MTFDEYMAGISARVKRTKERYGQAAVNLLREVNPALEDKIWGTTRDPFYQDSRCPLFFEYVKQEWNNY